MQPAEPTEPPRPPQPPPWKVPPSPATPPSGTIPPPAAAPAPGADPGTGSPPTGLTSVLDLRVGKRLLWVGEAVYPLQSVARVYTYTLRPRRAEAVTRFVRRVGLTLAVTAMLTLLGGVIAAVGQEEGPVSLLGLLWLAALAALVYSLVDMIRVLSAPALFVLGVETSGPSTAVVAGRDHAQLRQLVHRISYAIEHPETEFQVRVETLVISSPSNYYLGDTVNMYGGMGNVGMGSA
ncbi:DUF6232 family protein [Streptomyces yaizuensis]|uniref:DUF6232 family protein n=1 Tax=Streptomyces yaizuensis TaxID=2989713 RepID=A0ABQ5NYA2_9ACTN|nr:DUF6232 family protein [Streptomyces sp. YSPA8]GLF95350.1 DUF6232 family protein [Streptomyces sp. YSPA8]